jgi:hypothetical protein
MTSRSEGTVPPSEETLLITVTRLAAMCRFLESIAVPSRITLVLYRRRRVEENVKVSSGLPRAFDKAVRRKTVAVARTCSMELYSIFGWKALPEAGFSKNVGIDGHRCEGSCLHAGNGSAGRLVAQGEIQTAAFIHAKCPPRGRLRFHEQA